MPFLPSQSSTGLFLATILIFSGCSTINKSRGRMVANAPSETTRYQLQGLRNSTKYPITEFGNHKDFLIGIEKLKGSLSSKDHECLRIFVQFMGMNEKRWMYPDAWIIFRNEDGVLSRVQKLEIRSERGFVDLVISPDLEKDNGFNVKECNGTSISRLVGGYEKLFQNSIKNRGEFINEDRNYGTPTTQ